MVHESRSQVKRAKIPVTRVMPRLHLSIPEQKTRLVDLGLELLAMGEMGAVEAVTREIQERGLAHA